MSRWLVILVAVIMLSGWKQAVCDDLHANVPLHLASSAALTYGLYALIHYGLGTKDKTPAYGFGVCGTQIAGAMWEMGDNGIMPDSHLREALELNLLGSALMGVTIWSFDL